MRKQMEVTTGKYRLRVRSGPGINNKVVGYLKSGDKAIVDKISTTKNGQNWYRIEGTDTWIAENDYKKTDSTSYLKTIKDYVAETKKKKEQEKNKLKNKKNNKTIKNKKNTESSTPGFIDKSKSIIDDKLKISTPKNNQNITVNTPNNIIDDQLSTQPVSKPVTDLKMNILDSLKNNSNKYDNYEDISYGGGNSYVSACLEKLDVVVKELESIAESSRQTASNTAQQIQVYAANESVESIKNKSKNDKVNKLESMNNKQEDSKVKVLATDEYRLARMIASFKK